MGKDAKKAWRDANRAAAEKPRDPVTMDPDKRMYG
jgi:hypothetical protein